MLQREIPPHIVSAVQSANDLIFDVDLTLTERHKVLSPELAVALRDTGKRLGICTSRALNELDEVFDPFDPLRRRENLMHGPVVLEDGGLVVRPGDLTPTLMVPQEHHEAVTAVVQHILSQVDRQGLEGKWHRLHGLERPLVHLPTQYDYKTSFSIWQHSEEGMAVLKQELHHTMRWVENLVAQLGVADKVSLLEIGDGTLRIFAPGRSKGVALHELHTSNVIDIRKTVYFGDGRNDVPAAEVLRRFGGTVVAVDTHCPELVQLADFVLPARGPQGLERFLKATFQSS